MSPPDSTEAPRPLTLSVVMCNYNHGRYLARALDAITSQSRKPDEFIILDDGSTDQSVSIIEPYAQRCSYIRFLRNEHNAGAMAAVQRAFNAVTGDYVYFGSADDYVLAEFFEKAMALAARHPDAGVIAGQWISVDEFGQPFSGAEKVDVSEWTEASYVSPDRYLREYLLRYPPLHSSSLATIYNRRCLHEAGGLRSELGFFCDTFAIRAISLKHGCCYLPQVFACWRQLSASLSHSTVRNPKTLLDVRARCVWLMRYSDLKNRFHEEYIQPWADAFLAFTLETTIQHARDSHHRWHSFLFTSIPRQSWLDRAVWWAACRLSLLSGKISVTLLRNRIANYEGDTSCYANRGT